jgi:hypothetical protein
MDQAGPLDLFHKDNCFLFLTEFSIQHRSPIIPGEILRYLIKLWEFSCRKIRIFDTTFVLCTLTKDQPISNEKWNSDLAFEFG